MAKYNKIIFLDIDGVLNVIPQGYDEFGGIFHEHFVENLKWIIDETAAKIVISSSWRLSGLEYCRKMWSTRKLPGEIIDMTPCEGINLKRGTLEGDDRGYEIQHWLDNNEVENYVILDDDKDMLVSQMNNFVLTSNNPDHDESIDGYGYGLTKECAQMAINILNS